MKETEILRGLWGPNTAPVPVPGTETATTGTRGLSAGVPPVNFSRGTSFVRGMKGKDKVKAHLTRGEAVLPVRTVQKVGPANIARLIANTNNGKAPVSGLHEGGHYVVGMIDVKPEPIPGVGDYSYASPNIRTGSGTGMASPAIEAEAQRNRISGMKRTIASRAIPPSSSVPPSSVPPTSQWTTTGAPHNPNISPNEPIEFTREPAPSASPAQPQSNILEEGRARINAANAAEAEAENAARLNAAEGGLNNALKQPVENATLGQRIKDVGSAMRGAQGESLTQRAGNTLNAAKNVFTGGGGAGGGEVAAASKGSLAGRVGGALMKGAGVVGLGLAEGKGVLDAINDSGQTVRDRVGMDEDTYNSFLGRVGANALSGAGRIGDALTGGYASKLGEGIVRAQNGQSFFAPENSAPAAAPAPASVYTVHHDASGKIITPAEAAMQTQAPLAGQVQNLTGSTATAAPAPAPRGLDAAETARRQALDDAQGQRNLDDAAEFAAGRNDLRTLRNAGWAMPEGNADPTGLSGLILNGMRVGRTRLAQAQADREFRAKRHADELGIRLQELGLKQAQWGMQRGDENVKSVLEGVKGAPVMGGSKEETEALTARNVAERQNMARNLMGNISALDFSRLRPNEKEEYIQHLNNVIDATQGVNKYQGQTNRGIGSQNPRDYFGKLPQKNNGIDSWVGRGSAKLTAHLPSLDNQGDIMRLANGAYVPRSAYMTADNGTARTDIGDSMKRLDEIHAAIAKR